MDEGLFWGFVVLELILTLIPLAFKGRHWALVSFIGFLFGLLFANTVSADGSIVVGYSTNGSVVTNITNSAALPIALLVLLSIVSLLITLAKAFDAI